MTGCAVDFFTRLVAISVRKSAEYFGDVKTVLHQVKKMQGLSTSATATKGYL
jgi:hypothetical protein